jgi:hypothetical protein
MKLPEPTTEQLLDKMMQGLEPQMSQIHKTSSDTGINTMGAVSTVIIAGVVFGAISPWWLALAVPLALLAWGSEVKYWRKK